MTIRKTIKKGTCVAVYVAAMFAIIALPLFCAVQVLVAESPQKILQQIQLQIIDPPSTELRLLVASKSLSHLRASWNGHGSADVLASFGIGLKDELGLSEEQLHRLPVSIYQGESLTTGDIEFFNKFHQTPEAKEAQDAITATIPPENPTEEQINAFAEARENMLDLMAAARQEEIENILTPEQMEQVRKWEMQMMPMVGGVSSPPIYSPLDLTEKQKKDMDSITEDMKEEFDRLTREFVVINAERMKTEFEKTDGEKISINMDNEYTIEFTERMRKFVEKRQTRLLGVLTKEQRETMQKILEEKIFPASDLMRRIKKESYIPGPGSWQPGDPLPEQFQPRQEKNPNRFPIGEKE